MEAYLAGTAVGFAVPFGSRTRGTADESSTVALRFPEDDRERFHARNRIDADHQVYAEDSVDVSDVEPLPTPVAYAALRDGIVLVGDERAVEERVEREYEASVAERERRELVGRLARGDT